MTTSTSLIEFLLNLLRDPEARDAFLEDGDGYLASCGIDHLSAADLHDSLLLLQDSQEASFDREYNTGGNSITVHTPPPAPVDHDDHEDAVQYLNNYITNNYVNDSDTIIDNSINQNIDTDGGDFDQDIDVDNTIATGDGAVAVGGDVEDSEIVTGDDNVVGDDNVTGDGNVVGDGNQAVTGDDNTTSFGSGDATSTSVGGDVNVSNGGAFSSGGDATGEYDVDDSFNETETTTTTNNEDSFNHDTDVDVDVNSHNDTETNTDIDSHDEIENHVASHNDADFHA
ncbi:hypothetical protein GCM10009609_12850 [Pseudonocardia aurantiaca]|uniref:IniB N-terminal domain-containing protein n=1 Tax=Pseudonocardia aurantiaca TaxID=75290 RepID=A0ABW4FD94_9PSEU